MSEGTSPSPSAERRDVPASSTSPGDDKRRFNTWIELSRTAYRYNLEFFRKLVGERVELSVVVKANAYGHGLPEIATLAADWGVGSFCVHSLDEALTLQRLGLSQDVLIMGHIPWARLAEAVAGRFRLLLTDLESARRLAADARRLELDARCHLKLETGTHRQGVDGEELAELLAFLVGEPRLRLEGVYTHFANIEDTTRHDYARRQLERFQAMVEELCAHPACRGVAPKVHAACSAATLLFPETHFDMVRLGISQYGLWPSKETFLSYALQHGQDSGEALQPILAWKTRIGQIKTVASGRFIGYGCSYQTTRQSRIAVLPVGYSDGYDRRLSNQSYVLIHGRRAPIRGRVCMNLTMVDVTDIPDAAVEDEVVLLGRQGEERISAAQLAELIGTISYEVVARIHPDLPRIWV